MAIKDMVVYLNSCSDGVAIFDATNHTQVRRADLVEKVTRLNMHLVIYYADSMSLLIRFFFPLEI
jgi:hypothetical protein